MSENVAYKLTPLPDELPIDGKVETLRLAMDFIEAGYGFHEAQKVASSIVSIYHVAQELPRGLFFNVHVIPHPKGWAVLFPGRPKLSVILKQYSDAVHLARKFALDAETSLVLHDEQGGILEVTSCLRDY